MSSTPPPEPHDRNPRTAGTGEVNGAAAEADDLLAAAVRPEPPASGPLPRGRRRVYYSIGEVCKMVGLKPHVLRYWETQFEELAPAKNRKGNRVYRTRDLEIISLIHRLVHRERYTLEGARRRLQEMREAGELESSSLRALESSFLRSLRGELEKLHSLLDPPA